MKTRRAGVEGRLRVRVASFVMAAASHDLSLTVHVNRARSGMFVVMMAIPVVVLAIAGSSITNSGLRAGAVCLAAAVALCALYAVAFTLAGFQLELRNDGIMLPGAVPGRRRFVSWSQVRDATVTRQPVYDIPLTPTLVRRLTAPLSARLVINFGDRRPAVVLPPPTRDRINLDDLELMIRQRLADDAAK
jgi:hypothetical protein